MTESPAPMPADDAIVVNERITIPRGELAFRASRAGGPGGQHVNTSSTRVELIWNFHRSGAVDAVRARLLEKLVNRLDGEGLRVVSSSKRSQLQNRGSGEAVAELVRNALVVKKAAAPRSQPAARRRSGWTKRSAAARPTSSDEELEVGIPYRIPYRIQIPARGKSICRYVFRGSRPRSFDHASAPPARGGPRFRRAKMGSWRTRARTPRDTVCDTVFPVVAAHFRSAPPPRRTGWPCFARARARSTRAFLRRAAGA